MKLVRVLKHPYLFYSFIFYAILKKSCRSKRHFFHFLVPKVDGFLGMHCTHTCTSTFKPANTSQLQINQAVNLHSSTGQVIALNAQLTLEDGIKTPCEHLIFEKIPPFCPTFSLSCPVLEFLSYHLSSKTHVTQLCLPCSLIDPKVH